MILTKKKIKEGSFNKKALKVSINLMQMEKELLKKI